MKARIQQIIFEADVHQNKDKKRLGFRVPIPAVDLLGIEHDGLIALIVKTIRRRPLYAGTKKMTSDCEVYGTDMNIKPGQTILVEISDPEP
jgi:hypothetical protein